MRHIQKTLIEYVRSGLSAQDFEGYLQNVPVDLFLKLNTHLGEVTECGADDGQCIIIRSDKLGRPVATNCRGKIADILRRRIFVETRFHGNFSERDILILVLEAILDISLGSHRNIAELTGSEPEDCEIVMPEYMSYPCAAVLARHLNVFVLLDVISVLEGPRHRSRIAGYLDVYNSLIETDLNLLETDLNPIYVDEEDGLVSVIGNPDEDSLERMSARELKVYTDSHDGRLAERLFAIVVRAWAVDGVAFDQSDSYGNMGNSYGAVAKALNDDLRRRGGIPSQDELKELGLYQKLSSAYSLLGRYVRNRHSYMHHLNRCTDICSYRIETPQDLTPDERLQFIDKAVSMMGIRESILQYDTVIMMAATAPSMPIPNCTGFLQELFERHIRHDGIRNRALLIGTRPFVDEDEEDSRIILYIYPLKTENKD